MFVCTHDVCVTIVSIGMSRQSFEVCHDHSWVTDNYFFSTDIAPPSNTKASQQGCNLQVGINIISMFFMI